MICWGGRKPNFIENKIINTAGDLIQRRADLKGWETFANGSHFFSEQLTKIDQEIDSYLKPILTKEKPSLSKIRKSKINKETQARNLEGTIDKIDTLIREISDRAGATLTDSRRPAKEEGKRPQLNTVFNAPNSGPNSPSHRAGEVIMNGRPNIYRQTKKPTDEPDDSSVPEPSKKKFHHRRGETGFTSADKIDALDDEIDPNAEIASDDEEESSELHPGRIKEDSGNSSKETDKEI